MVGTDIMLMELVINKVRHRDMLAEADRDRAAARARAARPRTRRSGPTGVRTAIAASLLRAGSWLMPAGVPDGCTSPG